MTQQILKININKIDESPYQGRLLMFGENLDDNKKAKIEQLANSIKESGLLNPISVRTTDKGYELIDGHRRLEAFRMLGIDTIDAIIKDADDRSAQVMSIVSNLQRENLTNIELALAFKKVLDVGVFKDQKELSQSLGKDQTYVGDILGTLKMDKRILEDLIKNKSTNDVRLLRSIRNVAPADEQGNSDEQLELYTEIIEKGMSRDEVHKMLQNKKTKTHTQIAVKLMPRRIEVDLPHKIEKKDRQEIKVALEKYLEELLSKIGHAPADVEQDELTNTQIQ